MGLTLLSAVPPAPLATPGNPAAFGTADAGSGVSSGLDFSALLGQQLDPRLLTSLGQQSDTKLPAATKSAQDDTEQPNTDLAATLAALGLVPQNTPTPTTGEGDTQTKDLVSDLKGKTEEDTAQAAAQVALFGTGTAVQVAGSASTPTAKDATADETGKGAAQVALFGTNTAAQVAGSASTPTAKDAATNETGKGAALQDLLRAKPESAGQTALPLAVQPGLKAENDTKSTTANLAGSDTLTTASPTELRTGFAEHLAAAGNHAAEKQPVSPHVATPLHDAHWAQDFGEKLVWVAKGEQQTAQISINPPQLGPVQITISLNGDQATASFASPHAEVRQAIQDSLPQLKEVFAGSGINLGQANIGAQQQQAGNDRQPAFADSNRLSSDNAILRADGDSVSGPLPAPIQRGRGLVDLFA